MRFSADKFSLAQCPERVQLKEKFNDPIPGNSFRICFFQNLNSGIGYGRLGLSKASLTAIIVTKIAPPVATAVNGL